MSFKSLDKYRFVNCAYLHVDSEANQQTDMLVKVVNELKYKIKQIDQTVRDGNNLKIDKLGTDFLKAIIFARPIFLFKSFAQTKWAKIQQKSLKYDPKKVKTVVNCAFLRSKTQILRNL